MKIMKSPAGSPANERPISITLTILSLLLGLAMLGLWLPVSTTGGPLPALQGEVALNHLKEQGLYGSLQEAVAAARYGFYQEPKRSGDWRANNPAQRLSARLTPDGLQVETGGDEGRSHRLGMKLRSAGYGERQMAAKAGRMTASGARAEIHYELPQSQSPNPQSAIIEWYHNTAAGLEQGFTIESAPGERRDGERLRVALALEGELRAEAVDGGQALEFTDDAGRRALRYDHLVVRDGAGRELAARMTAPEDGGEVWLEVDDREAVWPVTIDPTFTQHQKLEASDPAAFDGFGFSVAISGETVVVGAPGDDSRGSAYVFARNGGVWSQQQKLLASDAAAGDAFGESVAISGETVVVGSGGGGVGGSAYVFARSSGVWSQQQKLRASDAAVADSFGASVAISGETVVVGAIGDDGAAGRDQGSAYVFARSGGVWSQQQKLEASDAALGDQFGFSVAVSGGTVVVGAHDDSGAAGRLQGSAYVFGPVPFDFRGFFPPVDNPPAVNVVNAGRAIPVKFSLSGDKGLNIFAAGFPVSQQIACGDGAPESEIEQTVTAGGSSLSYDAESDTYTYVWKTEKSWAGTCRQLIVRLNDGSERVAFFKFK